jgi:hypothetical protein
MLSRSVYHEDHEGHEGLGNYYISISNFVLFATFVVIMSGSILVATSPRWVLRGENFFTVKPEEAKQKNSKLLERDTSQISSSCQAARQTSRGLDNALGSGLQKGYRLW